MKTECIQEEFAFQGLNRREVKAEFSGGMITSDSGGVLLREVEAAFGMIEGFAKCFTDYRDSDLIEHTVFELVAQRIYGLALGYEDLNDHDELRLDPLLATLVNKADPSGGDRARSRDKGKALAGKSTLNRLELTPPDANETSRYKKIVAKSEGIERYFVDLFLRMHKTAPSRIVLDLDATDDPLHGDQEGRFFHGYYEEYCYLPLYIFCGHDLLCAKLRPSDIDASSGAVEELARIVEQIRETWPEVQIVIRADSGFCREEIMSWCEDHTVGYILGLAKNDRLKRHIAPAMEEARGLFEQTGKASRVFTEFMYQTRKSWRCARRVIGKAEYLSKGENPRFVVTSFSPEEFDAKTLYEKEYCARGEMENRIKEQQLYMFSDRTSSATMRANQLRLWFSSVAYSLVNAFRTFGLAGTELEKAQCHTIREKLFKIGAMIKLSVRRVLIMLSEACPYKAIFAAAYRNIRALMPRRC